MLHTHQGEFPFNRIVANMLRSAANGLKMRREVRQNGTWRKPSTIWVYFVDRFLHLQMTSKRVTIRSFTECIASMTVCSFCRTVIHLRSPSKSTTRKWKKNLLLQWHWLNWCINHHNAKKDKIKTTKVDIYISSKYWFSCHVFFLRWGESTYHMHAYCLYG